MRPNRSPAGCASAPLDTAPSRSPSRPLDDRTVNALLGDQVAVGDAGDEAAAWFSAVLGEPARLVALTSPTPDAFRWSRPSRSPSSTQDRCWSPASPRLQTWFVGPASRSASNASARTWCSTPTPHWAEDTWKTFSVGGAELTSLLAWPRCPIPQIDQDTSERFREPALALRAHRWCTSAPNVPTGLRAVVEGKGLFGVAATIGAEGTVLRVGDELSGAHHRPNR